MLWCRSDICRQLRAAHVFPSASLPRPLRPADTATMNERGPVRLPSAFLQTANGYSTASSLTSDDAPDAAMAELLRQRLGLGQGGTAFLDADEDGSESLLDYDPDDDDEVVFDDGSDGASNGGRDSRHKTPECLIKTTATIVVQKSEVAAEADRPTLQQLQNRQLLLFVPPSRMKEPLSRRFANHNQRMMKRDLTQEQRLLNYLRFKGDAGFDKAFAGTAEAKAKLAERIRLLQQSGAKPTMHDKFLEPQANDDFDHEAFWREQVALWIMKYEWRRREGPQVSKSELDREIDEWMAQNGDFATAEEMQQDLNSFMSRKGYDKETSDGLDADMNDYWKQKGRLPLTDDDTDDTSTVTSVQTLGSRRGADYNEQDLDNDLADYLKKRGSSSVTADDMDCDDEGQQRHAYSSLLGTSRKSAAGSQPLTPAERMKRAAASRSSFSNTATTPASANALDEDLDAYFVRKKMLEEKEKAEAAAKKKLEEQVAVEAAVGEGDRFADCPDFEDDDELEWQT